ncbi:cellulase family glycosylhydrolase [Sphingomonas psychrotolerans]|uniref:Cellulase family glycosylhydrolase n=1 Tax=Sphingomonas psychrotolerans TaxID=1327635 RepID=A0ABU3N6L4_9SPHN|nr:cellulase family glycosylhydrolase [Sphingomonas psychrotolerans]MDT8760170.1 cellulase family glycosylhydrolase [Sphingomonas psychrotolerans]
MRDQWTTEQAHHWWAKQPWPMGCNFTPSNAINQLEMWQAETFDLPLIEAELALAASVGMNAVRVYLHDLLWVDDAAGFLQRVADFLTAADRHGIRTMFVLFDSCWHPEPALGAQPQPRPGVHNSGWVQSPGIPALRDPAQRGRLEAYVRGVVGRFGKDLRVLAWDVWNEPDNGPEVSACNPDELAAKADLVLPLLRDAFSWAREMDPIQPLTSAIWLGDWSSPDRLTPLQHAQTSLSDVVSFHNYGSAEDFARRVDWLRAFDRPLLCTEFMARPAGSTFEAILPVAKAGGVGAFCWGLVRGKTQTHLPWESWESPNLAGLEGKWFHDIFEVGGIAHDPQEVELLRLLSAIDTRTPHWPLVEVARDAARAAPAEVARDAKAA